MAALRTIPATAALALVAACYTQDPSLHDTFPEPTIVYGPPGGVIDPAWTQTQPMGDPGGYAGEYAPGGELGYVEASADPADPGYVMGTATDEEIDATLDGYGEWIYLEDYGEVWRPYATVVGVSFTPYETCGRWVWTDWGWTFACDWDWGWLPFHYGRWGWFDDYWAWVPGYEWSPGWVEWRGGGGYVGWRPLPPTVRDHRTGKGPRIRDHRTAQRGPRVRDHRTGKGPHIRDHRTGKGSRIRDHRTAKQMDSHWRFTSNQHMGKRIGPHLFNAPAEGLRVTKTVARPPVRGIMQPVRAASLMRGRLATAHARDGRRPQRVGPARGAAQGAASAPGRRPASFDRGPRPPRGGQATYQPTWPGSRAPNGPRSGHVAPQPSHVTPDRAVVPPSHSRPGPRTFDDRAPAPGTRAPGAGPIVHPPRPTLGDHPRPPRTFGDRTPGARPDHRRPPTYTPNRPQRTWGDRTPGVRPDHRPAPTHTPSRPRPPRTWGTTPSRPRATWTAPRPSTPPRSSAPTWSPPSRSSGGSHSPPSRSPSGSHSSPSRSSGSWGSPSRSSGGSYSSPSRSSGSWGSPSRSSGSSRGSSRGGFGGGRRR